MRATVYTKGLDRLTAVPVRLDSEAALLDYCAEVFAAYPHADSVRAEGDDGIRRIRYRNGFTTHHEPISVLA